MGPFGSDIKAENFVASGVPVLNGSNVSGVKMTEEFSNFLTVEKADSLKKANAKRGDIIITHRGTLGQICYIPYDSTLDRYVISQSQFRVTLNTDLIDPVYFAYYFHTDEGQSRLLSFKNHVGVPALAQATTNFRLLEFPYRPLAEQKRIAKILDSLDSKIELNNRPNQELEAIAKLLYDYWFVQFDFPMTKEQAEALSKPELVGKPYKTSGGPMAWNEKLKREIPERWAEGIASDLFVFNPSLPLKKGEMSSYIDMNSLPTSGYMTGVVKKKEFNGGMKFVNGDVLVARITPCLENGKTGMITLLKEGEVGFGSTEFIVIRGKNGRLSSYAACLSRSERFRRHAIGNMTGTSGRKRVDAKMLEIFPMAIPDPETLTSFENLVSPFFKMMTKNTLENQHLASVRDWLLPMLMNGQVKVRVPTDYKFEEEELRIAAEPEVKYESRRVEQKPTLTTTDMHAAVLSKVIHLHEESHEYFDNLSHIKCEKIAHLVEYHLGIDLGRNPVKDAAGPDDYPHLKKIESRAMKAGFFTKVKKDVGYAYQSGRQAPAIISKAEKALCNEKVTQLNEMLALVLPFDLQEAEVLATTYAGWNNLLLDGLTPTDEEIVTESRENWSKRKLGIDRKEFFDAIEWMRNNGMVPGGTGKRVNAPKSNS